MRAQQKDKGTQKRYLQEALYIQRAGRQRERLGLPELESQRRLPAELGLKLLGGSQPAIDDTCKALGRAEAELGSERGERGAG